ncbi:hypothetical protein PN462_18600 [Spirulina sp. CS-785/01]|uniref:hypothetical protein n=1 Tax=Spirulina sp. CS-785/01 TaxID=3021716 RepID=UPI0023314E67|nr:hypothetical protein [Spirulina sp. CS-785/01]MDB9315132.1 hypothetical protein [Spirulina sp. CS-785/01]
MNYRVLTIALLSLTFWLVSFIATPVAQARMKVQLDNLSYEECGAEYSQGNVTSMSMQEANCFLITGKATNPSDKYVVDADVFGRIYDANGNPAMQNRTRIGTIPTIPPGESEFQIRISVPATQPTPLKLEQFKASGFTSKVRPYYYKDEDTLY